VEEIFNFAVIGKKLKRLKVGQVVGIGKFLSLPNCLIKVEVIFISDNSIGLKTLSKKLRRRNR
jgi:hypothetical protein